MRRNVLPLVIICLLVAAGQTDAEMCTIDVVPAATLLLPYFEVDWQAAQFAGITTILSVNNASPEPALGHVIIWSDWGAPVGQFHVFLTGYDIVSINLWDVLKNGNIPITADEQSDPDDNISPQGKPSWDGSFTGCDGFLPHANPYFDENDLIKLQEGLTGQNVASVDGCLGQNHGDNIARGYVTVNNVSECSLDMDFGAGSYFVDGGLGIANDDNQLWGSYSIVDQIYVPIHVDPLVHIEADPAFDGLPTSYTFYGRYVGASGWDDREPLGTAWGVRYINSGFFLGSEFVVWRDSTADTFLPTGAPCGVGPDWYPLPETEVVCFDEEENSVEICTGGTACFPLATQKVSSNLALGVPYSWGWCHLNLNIPADVVTGDVDFPPPDGPLAQSYVAAVHNVTGGQSAGLQAVQLTDACEDLDILVGVGDSIFADGFESGDTSVWSSTTP